MTWRDAEEEKEKLQTQMVPSVPSLIYRNSAIKLCLYLGKSVAVTSVDVQVSSFAQVSWWRVVISMLLLACIWYGPFRSSYLPRAHLFLCGYFADFGLFILYSADLETLVYLFWLTRTAVECRQNSLVQSHMCGSSIITDLSEFACYIFHVILPCCYYHPYCFSFFLFLFESTE